MCIARDTMRSGCQPVLSIISNVSDIDIRKQYIYTLDKLKAALFFQQMSQCVNAIISNGHGVPRRLFLFRIKSVLHELL